DFHVTGVQTCALPISERLRAFAPSAAAASSDAAASPTACGRDYTAPAAQARRQRSVPRPGIMGVLDIGFETRMPHHTSPERAPRSEERRVGKGVDQGA